MKRMSRMMSDDTGGFDAFMGADIRVGIITAVEDFPKARKPAWKLTVDFGNDIGTRRSSAQIIEHYSKEDLVGRKVLGLVNVAPRQIGPFMSECLTLGLPDADGHVVLIEPERDVPIGGRLF